MTERSGGPADTPADVVSGTPGGGIPGTAADGPDQMGREMAEGPEAVERTLAQVELLRPALEPVLASAGRIVLVGTGASLDVVRAAGPLWRARLDGPHLVIRQSAEIALGGVDGEQFRPSDLVVLVSQSGTSPETIVAARSARGGGATVVVVTAHPESALAALASPAVPAGTQGSDGGLVLALGSGEEEDASTKSALASLAGLLALAGLMPAGPADASAVADRLRGTIASWTDAETIGRRLAASRNVWLVGFGAGLGIAEAGALLWHEKVIRPAVAATPSEFRHGLIEAAGSGDAVVLVAFEPPEPRTDAYIGRLRAELRELDTALVVIGGAGTTAADPTAADPTGPDSREMWLPVGGSTTAVRALEALLRVQQLARAAALAAGSYRDGFAVLRAVVMPANDLLAG